MAICVGDEFCSHESLILTMYDSCSWGLGVMVSVEVRFRLYAGSSCYSHHPLVLCFRKHSKMEDY